MKEPCISSDTLGALLADARFLDSPHIDLGPALGLDLPLLVGVHDLHALVTGGAASLQLQFDGKTLTAQPKDGGAMFTFTMNI